MKAPKHYTAKTIYLKISGLALYYCFTRFFAKKHALNAQAKKKKNPNQKSPTPTFSQVQ